MKFVNSKALTVLLPVIYVALLVCMVIYAFSHSKQANLGLAVLMLFGPGIVMFTYARLRTLHHRFAEDRLKSHRAGIFIGFLMAFIVFIIGAFLIKEPGGQVLVAIGPFGLGLVMLVSYVGDKISRARREEQRMGHISKSPTKV